MERTIDLSIIHEIELIYRPKLNPSQRPQITSSVDLVPILRANWDPNKINHVEQFKVVLLNNNGRVLGIQLVATGGVSSCMADPRLIFGAALMGISYQTYPGTQPSWWHAAT